MRAFRGTRPPAALTRRRAVSWLVGLAVVIMGVFASYAPRSCADDGGRTPAPPSVSVGAAAAPQVSPGPLHQCDGEAHIDASPLTGIALESTSRVLDCHEAVVTLLNLHRESNSGRFLAGTGHAPAWCEPAGLAIADLAVTRV